MLENLFFSYRFQNKNNSKNYDAKLRGMAYIYYLELILLEKFRIFKDKTAYWAKNKTNGE